MKKEKIFYGWWIVIGCMIITTTMVPPVMALANKYLIQVTSDMNISRSAFTLTSTIIQSLGIFLSPFVAKKLANGNMRKIQSISIICFALSYASYSLAQNVIHLYISAFLVGIFYLNATLIPVSMIITNWFTKKRGLAMSLAMAGIGLGGFIFSPIVTYLLSAYGWRMTYLIIAIVILVLALPTSLFILCKKPEDKGLKPYGYQDSSSINNNTSLNLKDLCLSVSQSKSKIFFWILLLGMLGNSIINAGTLGQFPPALQEMYGETLQATIISIYSIVGIFGKLLLGWINDKFGIVASTTYGCFFFFLALICILFGNNVTMIYAMGIAYGLGNAIGTVSPPLITAAIFGQEKYGEAYGIVNSASQVGLAIGSLIVASIFDITKSYTYAWILLIVISVISYLCWIGSYKLSRRFTSESVNN